MELCYRDWIDAANVDSRSPRDSPQVSKVGSNDSPQDFQVGSVRCLEATHDPTPQSDFNIPTGPISPAGSNLPQNTTSQKHDLIQQNNLYLLWDAQSIGPPPGLGSPILLRAYVDAVLSEKDG